MSVVAAVTIDVPLERLAALGNTGQPLYRWWLALMADIDRRAKLKLSNQMLHVRTGNLRSSQQVPVVTMRGGMLVGVVENTANYARALHDGSRPHDIRPRNGKFLTGWTYGGRQVFTPLVHHPGTKPRPWLTEAMREAIAART